MDTSPFANPSSDVPPISSSSQLGQEVFRITPNYRELPPEKKKQALLQLTEWITSELSSL